MPGVRITGAEHPVKDIFSDAFLFEIPPYQRAYSWTTDQAAELIDDLLSALEETDLADPDPYFLGSVVLAKTDGEPHAKVIDGQQRLTTLTILLAALAEALPEKQGEKLRVFIRQEANEFAGTEDVPRLTLRPRDSAFFRDHIQEPGGLAKLLATDPAQLDNDAQRNIRDNAHLLATRVGALDAERRSELGRFILGSCFLVAVSTPDRDTAYRIFTILNDRGLDLSHADILKSELIGEITDTGRQDACTKLWEDAEAELGRDAFGELFSHIRMIYAKSKMRGTVLKEFRQYVFPTIDDPAAFIEEVVVPLADVYARIRTESWETTAHADTINRALTWLNQIDNFDWIPPAILFMHRHQHAPEQLALFLARLERLAASMYVRRIGINARIDRYADLLRGIAADAPVLVQGSDLDLTETEKEETRAHLNGEVYLHKPRLYILKRLDDALSAGGASYDHKIITVEHVLPQTPSTGSQWESDFSQDDRSYWTHRLANLVLLPRRKNSAAQNYDFGTKKEKYFTGADGTSPFVLTTQVLGHASWTPALLKTRQTDLTDKLIAVWHLE